jgi:hypothetical protein
MKIPAEQQILRLLPFFPNFEGFPRQQGWPPPLNSDQGEELIVKHIFIGLFP